WFCKFGVVIVSLPHRARSWRRNDRSPPGLHRRLGAARGSSTLARMAFGGDKPGHDARTGDWILRDLLGARRAGCSRICSLPDQRDLRLEVAAGIKTIACRCPCTKTGMVWRLAGRAESGGRGATADVDLCRRHARLFCVVLCVGALSECRIWYHGKD